MSELYFPSLTPVDSEDDGPSSTAELQGALCGLLCFNPHADRANWAKKLFEDFQPDDDELLDLSHLFDITLQSLNSLDFDFQLELPNDDAPIASRAYAMTQWCQGLIYGLGTSGLTDDIELSIDCKEYLSDVINISQLNIDDDSENDADFEELAEYLRMGLFLLFGELQPVNASDSASEH